MQRQRGFTLLEIMVVIVILGILASLVVPNLMGNKEKADRQKVVSDLVALEGALDMYKLDNSRYPNTEQGLEGAGDRSGRRAACPQLPGRRLYPPSAAGPVGE
ncbi:pullulanase G protein [Klebsiella pneumoniae subsp. pneumoniae]|nr:pullulanase G protein [Klebsiella pneumoniae subsp. pneumoniae]